MRHVWSTLGLCHIDLNCSSCGPPRGSLCMVHRSCMRCPQGNQLKHARRGFVYMSRPRAFVSLRTSRGNARPILCSHASAGDQSGCFSRGVKYPIVLYYSTVDNQKSTEHLPCSKSPDGLRVVSTHRQTWLPYLHAEFGSEAPCS